MNKNYNFYPLKSNNSFSGLPFFNDNLSFYNTYQSITSSAKIFAEISAGTAAGYGGAMLVKSMFKTSIEDAELGSIILVSLIAFGAIYGNTGGVFLMGNFIGDQGSFYNTLLWSCIGATVFYTTSGLLTNNNDKKLLAAAAGFPVGAMIGFNSNHLDEIIRSFIYP